MPRSHPWSISFDESGNIEAICLNGAMIERVVEASLRSQASSPPSLMFEVLYFPDNKGNRWQVEFDTKSARQTALKKVHLDGQTLPQFKWGEAYKATGQWFLAISIDGPFTVTRGRIGRKRKTQKTNKCQCGITAIGGGIHSSWCPLAS